MNSRRFIIALLIAGGLVLSACNPFQKPAKAGLQVITGNETASVFLGGQYLEKSPLINKELKPGEYILRIEPDNTSLLPYETQVILTKGLITVVTWKPGATPEQSGGVIYEMEKIASRKSTEVAFTSIPDNAIIKISGRDKEFTPVVITDLPPGEHEYEITLPSYETQKHTLNVVKGHKITVTVKLAKLDENASEETATQPQPTPTPTGATKANSLAPLASGSAQVGPKVIIEKTNFFQEGKEVLRVRSGPSGGAAELGFATVGESYPYLEVKQNGWYKIAFEDAEGWVSASYATLEE